MLSGKIDAFPVVWACSIYCHRWLDKKSKMFYGFSPFYALGVIFSPFGLLPDWKAILRQDIWQESAKYYGNPQLLFLQLEMNERMN
jgi:hypothetical protein